MQGQDLVKFTKLAEEEKKLFREARKKGLQPGAEWRSEGDPLRKAVPSCRSSPIRRSTLALSTATSPRSWIQTPSPISRAEPCKKATWKLCPSKWTSTIPRADGALLDGKTLTCNGQAQLHWAPASIYTCFQLAAPRKWKAHVKDVKTAFLQGDQQRGHA